MPETHHRFGPSTLKYRAICPGWKPRPDSETAAADEGTLMHLAFETGDMSGIPPEHAALVQWSLNVISDIERDADEVLKEMKLDIAGVTWGTADRVIVKGRKAWMVDLKTGWGYVDHSRHNRQGQAYACGVFELFERFPDIEEIEVMFVIPKREEVLRHTFKRALDLAFLQAVVTTIVNKANNWTQADLYPCEEACEYCGRCAECPALAKRSLILAKRYAPLEIVDDIEVHSSQVTDPSQMAKLMDIARVVEKFAESVKKHACDLARQGVAIPGYSLRERDGARKITAPVGASIATLETARLLELPIETTDLFGVADFKAKALEELIVQHCDSREDKERALALLNEKLIENDAVEEGAPIVYLQKNRRNPR